MDQVFASRKLLVLRMSGVKTMLPCAHKKEDSTESNGNENGNVSIYSAYKFILIM